jgi:hypothetical protein
MFDVNNIEASISGLFAGLKTPFCALAVGVLSLSRSRRA